MFNQSTDVKILTLLFVSFFNFNFGAMYYNMAYLLNFMGEILEVKKMAHNLGAIQKAYAYANKLG